MFFYSTTELESFQLKASLNPVHSTNQTPVSTNAIRNQHILHNNAQPRAYYPYPYANPANQSLRDINNNTFQY